MALIAVMAGPTGPKANPGRAGPGIKIHLKQGAIWGRDFVFLLMLRAPDTSRELL